MDNKKNWSARVKEFLGYCLIILVGLGIGLSGKYAIDKLNEEPAFIQTNTQAHFEHSANKVIIYTTQWCPYCKQAKQLLTQNNIAFTERDIEQGDKSIDTLYATIGSPGVPKVIIGDVIINGFNPELITENLKKQALL